MRPGARVRSKAGCAGPSHDHRIASRDDPERDGIQFTERQQIRDAAVKGNCWWRRGGVDMRDALSGPVSALMRKGPRALLALGLVLVGVLLSAEKVGAASNLVGNPGFETGTSGWNTSGGASNVALTQVAGGHSGSYSAKLTNQNTSTATCLLNDSPNWVAKTVAGSYTGSLWVRTDTAGATLTLRFREYNSSGTRLGLKTSTVTLTTTWQPVSVTLAVASPGSSFDFNAYITNAAPGTCFYADDASIVNTPATSPPTAALTVTPTSGTAPLQVSADASKSTAGSAPISSYKFDFGDGSAVVGPQAGATASHTYVGAGRYTVTVTVTDTAGQSSTATANVNASPASPGQVAVYAGYYDTHHRNTLPKPSPWLGSPNVVFLGTPDSSSGGWDSSGVRIDNLSGASLGFVSVTVDIGKNHFALWNTTSVAPGQTLIVAQTAYENFDGSDTNPAGCYGCAASTCTIEVQSTIPVVHVTVDGVTTNYADPQQILNTKGVDAAGCPYTGGRNDESQTWQQLSSGP
jgi:PKD repeat protein